MVAAEAAAAGAPPLVARHSGLAEVAAGLEEDVPAELRHLASFANGDARELRERLGELLASRRPTARDSAQPRAAPPSSAGAGRASPSGCSQPLQLG